MGFSLHLHTCNLGTEIRMCQNPFTGEAISIPRDPGLTLDESQAVRRLLEEVEAGEPDADTYRHIEFADGSLVSVAVGRLLAEGAACRALAVECSVLTASVADFLYALASRGNLSIGSSIDPKVVVLLRAEQSKLVSRRWPEANVVESPSQLRDWLERNLQVGKIV